jgi:anti-sigma factor RsiW
MCPDKELLSSYMDGEVPSPWKEKMELHIAGCPSCSARVMEYSRLAASLKAAGGSAGEDRILGEAAARIAASLNFDAPAFDRRRRFSGAVERLWSTKVSLPMPYLAAGAAALLAAGIFFGAFRGASGQGTMASTSRTLQPRQVSLESIAQNVRQSSLQPVMIDMPAESVFSQYGNPVIVSFGSPQIQEVGSSSAEDR